jgi:hypothetical protein
MKPHSTSDHMFDPYSPEVLDYVERVEALPHSIAFEHAMFEHRLDRTVSFDYAHDKDENGEVLDTDLQPFVIEPTLMFTQFPEQLRPSFPDIGYTIERLQIQQIDTPDALHLEMAFIANGTPHHFKVDKGKSSNFAQHETVNEQLEPVLYSVSHEAVAGLIATFVYAQQYDPLQPSRSIELSDTTLTIERDPITALTEQLVMTLGDHTGHSSTTTRGVFENPKGPPVIATLIEREYPDKSGAGSDLTLVEINDVNDIPTSTETNLHQNVINIEQGTPIVPPGQIAARYAEQISSVLKTPGLRFSEYIDPDLHYQRWARTCTAFMKLIRKPMRRYAHLDSTNSLD